MSENMHTPYGMPRLPEGHQWIMLDNGEHRCDCGWSPNYYAAPTMTFEAEVAQHRDEVLAKHYAEVEAKKAAAATPSTEYVKITIIIEDSDSTTTVRIPKAANLKLTKEPRPDSLANIWADPGNYTFFETAMDFDMSFTALLDDKAGHIFVAQKITTATEIKKD